MPSEDNLFLLAGDMQSKESLVAAEREAVARGTPITEFRLARNGPVFDGNACAALLAPLVAPDGVLALTALALGFNSLGAHAAAALGAALGAGRLAHVASLQLQGCALGADGAAALANDRPTSVCRVAAQYPHVFVSRYCSLTWYRT